MCKSSEIKPNPVKCSEIRANLVKPSGIRNQFSVIRDSVPKPRRIHRFQYTWHDSAWFHFIRLARIPLCFTTLGRIRLGFNRHARISQDLSSFDISSLNLHGFHSTSKDFIRLGVIRLGWGRLSRITVDGFVLVSLDLHWFHFTWLDSV